MKKFVTIFPRSENVHLVKDVGMIPYTFYKDLGYTSSLVTIENGEYLYNELYTKGLELEFIEGDQNKCAQNPWYELKLIHKYLKANAKQIDVLHLFHFSYQHLFAMAYYKWRNPKGITYLKLDAALSAFSNMEKPEEYLRRKGIKNIIRKWLIRQADIISVESKILQARVEKVLNREAILVPNGFFEVGKRKENISRYKENLFATVGRLGSKEKNTESILRAFSKIYRLCDWNLVLAGSAEGEFLSYMEKLCQEHQGLSERIKYVGQVKDKEELEMLYLSTKVFLLPSRWESFGLVVCEAQSCGCHVILSNQVAPCEEFTDKGRLGEIIPTEDDDALAEAMLKATRVKFDYKGIQDYAYEHYTWGNICANIEYHIQVRRKERKVVE